MQKIYKVREVASELRTSYATALTLIKNGSIKGFNVSAGKRKNEWRVTEGALNAFINKNSNEIHKNL